MNLINVCAISILSLGIISCLADKRNSSPSENFTVRDIKVQNSDKSYLLAPDIEWLSPEATLELTSLKEQDFKKSPIIIKMIASCTHFSDNSHSSKETYWLNVANLKVVNILPEEVLSVTDNNPVNCDFIVTATSATNSTHISQLSSIKIKNLAEFNNWEWSKPYNHQLVMNGQITYPLSETQENFNWRLTCGNFSKTMAAKKDLTLNQFFDGNDKFEKGLQNCKLLKIAPNSILVSEIFKVTVPANDLIISTEVMTNQELGLRIDTLNVMQVLIKNPNPFPVLLVLGSVKESTFCFQPVLYPQFTVKTFCKPLRLLIDEKNIKVISRDNNQIVISIAGNQTTQIIGSSRLGISCVGEEPNFSGVSTGAKPKNHLGALSFNVNFGGNSYSMVEGSNFSKPASFPVTNQLARAIPEVSSLPYWIIQLNLAGQESNVGFSNYPTNLSDEFAWLQKNIRPYPLKGWPSCSEF